MKYGFTSYRLLILLAFLFGYICLCASENVKKSIDDLQDESNEGNDDTKESLDIMPENENTEQINSNSNNSNNYNSNENDSNNKNNNSTTCTRRANSQMHEILTANHKQFPFMAAIMSHQNDYLCAGSVVSNGVILTSAECLQKPVNYVLLNTTKAKKEDTAVMLYIKNREKFPSFAGSRGKDIGIIFTEKHNNSVASKIKLSNMTSLKGLTDFEGLGYGLNTEVNQIKELQYIGVEYRPFEDYPDLLEGYFDCVDTKIPTCFKDFGGPAIFDNELIGVISSGQNQCTSEMSSKYAVSKKLVRVVPTYSFKAWLEEKIAKVEEKQPAALATYPSQPAVNNVTKNTMCHIL
ncbi:TNF receptor-associated factor family protein DDB_G0272098 [Amyelois transitella]|uniref:TNF receptor-associated factor family protein DDB_G0272098 n=1 Tax=Amyelois transitella TaxID=680683 RepID=UPI00298FA192|nr:TNF receptor-associated factor family protein DDB_G0272098 [Amyelois transitella]